MMKVKSRLIYAFLLSAMLLFGLRGFASNAALQVAESHTAKVVMAAVDAETAEAEATSMASNINWLLVIVVILLVAIIGLVFDILAKVGDIQQKPVLNWGNINSKMLLIFGIVGLILTAWQFMEYGPLTTNAQEPASAHGPAYESMFMITLVLTGIVFVITQALLFWYGYKYKHDAKRKGLYYPDNHKLEFWWTIVPAVVLTVLVVRGLMTWNNIMFNEEKAQNIEVYGYQFAWNARYAGADNTLGKHDFRKAGVINMVGVDTNVKEAFDDVVTSELHLKVGQPVMLHFRAKDVIHSAYLPHFRVQMNVVPGLPTKFAFTPTITTNDMRNKMKDPKFDYILLCNKICGSAHYRMKMKVVVDSPADFNKWMKSQPALTQKGTETNMAFDFAGNSTMKLASN